MKALSIKTTYPKIRITKDERIFTLDHYYIGLDWWMRHGHFNEDLYRQLVRAKNSTLTITK
jgi:hypothetical protein